MSPTNKYPNGLHLVQNAMSTVKRDRRRKSGDPIEAIQKQIPGMARKTCSLVKTAANLGVREAQVTFYMSLELMDMIYQHRNGFGKPAGIATHSTDEVKIKRAVGGVA